MIKPLRFLFATKPDCPALSELDEVYKEAISQLPDCTKKEYCKRLLSRTEFDLRNIKCDKRIKHLKKLAEAAKKEISNFNSYKS